jgi:hypothetical protein
MTVEHVKDLGFEVTDTEVANLEDMSNAQNIPMLLNLGRKAAEAQVSKAHFSNAFDRM